jgi:hypothetical protein
MPHCYTAIDSGQAPVMSSCEPANKTFSFHKIFGVSQLTKWLLPYQDTFCSKEVVTHQSSSNMYLKTNGFPFFQFFKTVLFHTTKIKCRGYFLARLCGIFIMLYNDLTLLCLICLHMERLGSLCAMNRNDQLNSVHILTPYICRMFCDLVTPGLDSWLHTE